MSEKSNVLTIRVPLDLKERIAKVAEGQGVSMNQFAIYAFTRQLGEVEVAEFLRAQGAGRTSDRLRRDFEAVLAKVPRRRARPAWDEPEDQARSGKGGRRRIPLGTKQR